MNLYVYGLEADFTKAQRSSLDSNFGKVEFVKQASFDRLFQDPEPKVIALDPDITGWNISNEDIVKIPILKQFAYKLLAMNGWMAIFVANMILLSPTSRTTLQFRWQKNVFLWLWP